MIKVLSFSRKKATTTNSTRGKKKVSLEQRPWKCFGCSPRQLTSTPLSTAWVMWMCTAGQERWAVGGVCRLVAGRALLRVPLQLTLPLVLSLENLLKWQQHSKLVVCIVGIIHDIQKENLEKVDLLSSTLNQRLCSVTHHIILITKVSCIRAFSIR